MLPFLPARAAGTPSDVLRLYVVAYGQPRTPDGFPLPAVRVAAFTLLAATGSTALLRALCEPLTGPPGGLLDAPALASSRASAAAERPLAAVLFLALSGAK